MAINSAGEFVLGPVQPEHPEFELGSFIQTIYNGEVLENYDKFERLIKQITEYFETVKDYKGFPTLPKEFLQIIALYTVGNETEKRYMFGYLSTLFIEALRHWKTDKDQLYPNSSKTPFYLG